MKARLNKFRSLLTILNLSWSSRDSGDISSQMEKVSQSAAGSTKGFTDMENKFYKKMTMTGAIPKIVTAMATAQATLKKL